MQAAAKVGFLNENVIYFKMKWKHTNATTYNNKTTKLIMHGKDIKTKRTKITRFFFFVRFKNN